MPDNTLPDNDIRAWPKIDLHCHLEGALRPQTVLELLQKNCQLHLGETVDGIRHLIQLTGQEQSFFDWIPTFNYVMQSVQTEDDLIRVTHEAVEDAHANGVIYLELRYAPFFIGGYNSLAPEAVIEAVCVGRQRAADHLPIHTELILIAQQTGGEAECNAIVDLALKYRDQGHGAVDIAGNMTILPLDIYAPIFARASNSGLGITVHAGEVAPADTVRTAVERLRATRVGHGIRSIEDDGVIDLLIERDILLEVCVSSNVQTRVVESLEKHPIKALADRGVRVSINTDDPGIQNIDLTGEYQRVMDTFGFSRADLGRLNIDAMRSAFTSETIRANLLTQLNAAYPA